MHIRYKKVVWNLPRICGLCKRDYAPYSPTQKYCGSIKGKFGCCFKQYNLRGLESKKRRRRDPEVKEKESRYGKLWRERNKEKSQKYYRARYEEWKEEILRRNKAWFLAHPDKRRAYKLKRKIIVERIDGSHSLDQWEALKAVYDYTCPKCWRREPEIKLTEDHKVAVSNGGSNYIDNIQPLCGSCNSEKHAATWFASCPLSIDRVP